MRLASSRRRPAALWVRVFASTCAALVFTLSLAAWSPDLHSWIHGQITQHEHSSCAYAPSACSPRSQSADFAHAAHECAVTLFAQGFTFNAAYFNPLDFYAFAPASAAVAPGRLHLPAPPHLSPLPQAPPLA